MLHCILICSYQYSRQSHHSFAASKQHFCVMYTTQYYLLKRFIGLDQVVSRWCCGLFRLSLLLIPCHDYVPQKYCTVLIFSSGFVMLSVIPYLDIHADHQSCLVSLLSSVNSSPPISPVYEDRNPVHWAFMFQKISRNLRNQKFLLDHHLGHNSCGCIFLKCTLHAFPSAKLFILVVMLHNCCI